MSKSGTGASKNLRDFVSQKADSLSPSGIRKFFDLISTTEGVISLGVGEPDFSTPWRIREAAIHSIEKGYTMYTSNYGLPELRQLLAQSLERQYGVSYHPGQELLITCGVSEALDLALRAVVNPGEEVIIPDPCYVAYSPCISLAGGIPVPVPTCVETGFTIMASEIEPKITAKTKAILIGYPANPTGAVMTKEELSQIASLAEKHDLLVISDEIYAGLVYEREHICFSSLPGARERTILLGGFSKTYAMTGWRVGYAAANGDIIEAMLKIHQYTALCAPITAQMAAVEALKSGEAEAQKMLHEYDRRRRIMVKRLNDCGLACLEPGGAFYAFPSIKITGMRSEEFARRLLKEEKVVVVPGSSFGQHGEGFCRCCYAAPLKEIEEALKRIGNFVRRHNATT